MYLVQKKFSIEIYIFFLTVSTQLIPGLLRSALSKKLSIPCFIPRFAFTLSGFDDQERNLTFVNTGFQGLKFKSSSLTILYILRDFDNKKYFYNKLFFRYLVFNQVLD